MIGLDDNRVVVSRDIQGREFTVNIMDFEEPLRDRAAEAGQEIADESGFSQREIPGKHYMAY